MGGQIQEFHYTLPQLRRRQAFAGVAATTLAPGIEAVAL
jgi:hypothetical protein